MNGSQLRPNCRCGTSSVLYIFKNTRVCASLLHGNVVLFFREAHFDAKKTITVIPDGEHTRQQKTKKNETRRSATLQNRIYTYKNTHVKKTDKKGNAYT